MKFQTTLLTAVLFVSTSLYAQPKIKGATCVLSGTVYDYLFNANRDSVTSISICIQGGVFTDTQINCKIIEPFSLIRVTWNEGAANAGLYAEYSTATDSLKINISTLLDAGKIDSTVEKQKLQYDSAPAIIICTPAKGGNCNPVYYYQWQQSADAVNWSDIYEANEQYLPSRTALKEPVFYRRKVTETISGTVGYSTITTVFVEADAAFR